MRLMTPGPERIVVREQPRGESGLVGRQRPAMSAIRIGDAGHDTTGDHAESLGADGVLGETSSAGFPLPGRRHWAVPGTVDRREFRCRPASERRLAAVCQPGAWLYRPVSLMFASACEL